MQNRVPNIQNHLHIGCFIIVQIFTKCSTCKFFPNFFYLHLSISLSLSHTQFGFSRFDYLCAATFWHHWCKGSAPVRWILLTSMMQRSRCVVCCGTLVDLKVCNWVWLVSMSFWFMLSLRFCFCLDGFAIRACVTICILVCKTKNERYDILLKWLYKIDKMIF